MFNFKKAKGFTLIELLIVVAIIGILAALLVPNALTAMQKARQKSCMKEIMTISTGAMDFITDNSTWINIAQSGPLDNTSEFVQALAPFYVRTIPINDPWNSPYQVFLGDEVADQIGTILVDDVGEDDYLVWSYGRQGEVGPTGPADYDRTDPDGTIYPVSTMSDFNNDLAAWSGAWIVAPRTVAEAT